MQFSNLLKIVVLTVIVLGLSSAYVRAFTVAGPSMTPTFLNGDLIVSNHAAYDLRLPFLDTVLLKTGEPQHGDLVMYFDEPKNVIATKRVVGVPGDAVRMVNNILYINGTNVMQRIEPRKFFRGVPAVNDLGELVARETLGSSEHLITYTPEKSPVHSFEEVKVTAGKYFILGDHRDNSADSRYTGLISREQIKGRVFIGARTLDSYAEL
jgi:signal peptidase I